jgi:hypothetical protein
MIGEAEIEELMCEYAEALKRDGVDVPEPSWPVTLATTPEEPEPVPVPAMFRWPFMHAREEAAADARAPDEHRTYAACA